MPHIKILSETTSVIILDDFRKHIPSPGSSLFTPPSLSHALPAHPLGLNTLISISSIPLSLPASYLMLFNTGLKIVLHPPGTFDSLSTVPSHHRVLPSLRPSSNSKQNIYTILFAYTLIFLGPSSLRCTLSSAPAPSQLNPHGKRKMHIRAVHSPFKLVTASLTWA